MLLKQINLHNFRNFDKKEFKFSPFLTIIIGENARGKTNILESIYFLINGIGFRETREFELVNFNFGNTASVEGNFIEADKTFNFGIRLLRKKELIQKTFLVNKSKKKQFQYSQEQTKAILFTPQQIEILTGSPDKRRDYFNKTISFYDLEYKRRLMNYENALRKRNKILERHIDQARLKEEISFWNEYLIEQSEYLIKKRENYVLFLNSHDKIDSKKFSIEYVKNEFSKKRLEDFSQVEARLRKTLIGPQKDDFLISLQNPPAGEKDIHKFGSRSEQRLAILWLKMNEISFHENLTKKKPILLFDDVFSELDIKNKKLVLDLFKKYQTIATTTEVEVLELAHIPKSVIKL